MVFRNDYFLESLILHNTLVHSLEDRFKLERNFFFLQVPISASSHLCGMMVTLLLDTRMHYILQSGSKEPKLFHFYEILEPGQPLPTCLRAY